MTTPMPPDPMGGTVSGSADLQASIDRLDLDMRSLTQAVQGMNNGNGTTTSPAMSSSFANQGVQFTTGSSGGGGGGLLSGFGASGGTGGTNPYSFSPNPAQAAVNIASSVINGQFKSGYQQLNDQAQINTYGYTQAAFWNVPSSSAIMTAFGGGNGRNLTQNNLATSASDARIGGMLLSQISGQANYTAGPGAVYGRGNAAFQLAATTGMANPGLGMANSAGIAGAWYNPSTSYNLMMMGIANTPLQLGTGRSQSMTGVEAAIGQRFGFQGFNSKLGTFNSQNLSANLDNPLFQMQIMEATGMSQQQYNVWSQQWAMLNNAALKSGTSMDKMQNEVGLYMNGTASQQKQAQGFLSSHGISQSLLQSLTQAQAGQTGAEAGGTTAFTKGLQDATGMVEKFTQALSKGYQAMAGTSGFAAGVGSLNNSNVIGAGSGGLTNAVVGSIAGDFSSLASDLSHYAADLTGYTNTGKKGKGAKAGNTGASTSTAAQNQAMARNIITQMPFARGWNQGQQWQDLLSLWNQESGWNANAQNPTSTAYGIAQFLDSTWAPYGPKTSDAATQIRYGLEYIRDRYPRGPVEAWQHEVNYNWYSDGTSSAKPGMAVVGERGPEVVALSGGQQIISAAQTAKMMQPKFSGGMPGEGGGFTIVFQHGAIQITNSGSGGTSGYHTSHDVQSTAAQLTQAVEISLKKSTLLQQIASGVTG